MKTIDIHRYAMLVRVREFGAAHGDLFPAAGAGGQMFAALSTAIDQFNANDTAQASGLGAVREGTMTKAVARETLRAALDAIALTARALAVDMPGLDGKFRLPNGRKDHEIATKARMFGQDAAPLKAQFVAHGLPETFLADLQAALDAFERATSDRFTAREAHVAARAGIGAAIDAASLALTRLDAIVPNTLRDTPTLLAAWMSARHVERVRWSSDRKPAPSTPPVRPPAAAAPDTGATAQG